MSLRPFAPYRYHHHPSLNKPNLSTAWIGLGSNLGDSLHILHKAWQRLGRDPGVYLRRLSTCYRSRPVDMDSDRWFINGVGELQTSLPPRGLLTLLLRVEKEFGRRRDPEASGHQDRTLDLDLLLYDDLIVDDPLLQLPHPRMHRRMFVLAPLAELAPNLEHPSLNLTMTVLKKHLLKDPAAAAIHQVTPVDDCRYRQTNHE
ncbi:MAG TPA: 2-amino-4-hydroxy-6-hydroxymethyldihydropteridine diphosphokinase [Desulfobulbaceae bacterium]|nr:2-amino-4-hydroxy-6-hydroxymethyldihydropteridine diphosphokinase [Desulfobulbaceae bacterium]